MDNNVLIIWRFCVAEQHRPEFEKNYGANGAWAQLFRSSPEYRGTRLLHDGDEPAHYWTIDNWTSEAAFARFKQQFAADYAALDKTCEALTESEERVGTLDGAFTLE